MKALQRICSIICLLLLPACNNFGKVEYDEVGSKPEFSILQKVELENRQDIISKPRIIERDGYIIVGCPMETEKRNTWILLNAKHSPYYKQIPQGNFTLTKEDLDRIRKIPGVSYTVIAVLESRISDAKIER